MPHVLVLHVPHIFSILMTSLMLTLAACGGGDEESTANPVPDEPAIEELQAEVERLRQEAEAAEAERLRLEALAELERLRREAENNEPTSETDTDTDTEDEEVHNPYDIPTEWVWHDGKFIPLEDVPVEPVVPQFSYLDAYLPWGYHEFPAWEMFDAWQDTENTALLELAHTMFGVVLHEGEYIPWMRGEVPEGSLYSNSSHVQRTYDEYGYWTIERSESRWRGFIMGLTPDGELVTGSATLSDFDFGGYSHRGIGSSRRGGWDPGKAYLVLTDLAYEDGDVWGDGELEYEVKLGVTLAHGGSLLDNSFSHPFRRYHCSRSPSGCQNDWA